MRDNRWTAGAEIGVARGWTSFHLLDRCPALHMTLVDAWRVVPDTGEPGWQDYTNFVPEYCARRVRERAAAYLDQDGRARCRVLHMDSVEAAACVLHGALDFVFIDGDHTARGVAVDVRAWARKVRPGGIVAGHDWHRPEVAAVIGELLPGHARHDHHVWSIARDDITWC